MATLSSGRDAWTGSKVPLWFVHRLVLGLAVIAVLWHYSNMCSSNGIGTGAPAGSSHAPTIAAELHAVLDRLLVADHTGLSAQEHATLVTRVVRAEHRLAAGVLDAVGAFDTADVAASTRHRTTRRWLELRTRMAPGTASHLARTARAVRDHLPATRDALADATISTGHVAAVVSVVSTVGAEHAVTAEPLLLDLAHQFPPSVVREAAARIHALVDPAGAEQALHTAYEKRGLKLSVGGGYGYLSGIFDLESSEVLQSALMPLMTKTGPDDARSTTQLRADALLDLAKRGLDAGLDTQLGGERPHLSIVIDEHALRSGIGTGSVPWTGAAWTAATARRWACDAQLTPVLATLLPPPNTANSTSTSTPSPATFTIGGGWLPLDVGRAARTVTTAQTKALRVRDGGCVHPGCSRTPAYCDAHHVVHWADGGATSLPNLVLLCRHHHRTLHHGLWSLSPDTGQPGRFWATSTSKTTHAQTAADRSPPIVYEPAGTPGPTPSRDPASSLWQ